MKTIQDVREFIEWLELNGWLYHADDDATDCLHYLGETVAQCIQDDMDAAIDICRAHYHLIWDFYPNLED